MVDFSSLPKPTYDWIREAPRNAKRYLELGETLWLAISKKLNLNISRTWEYILFPGDHRIAYASGKLEAYLSSAKHSPPPRYFFECELAFNTALSLGLSNPLDAAKASFRLIEINLVLAEAYLNAGYYGEEQIDSTLQPGDMLRLFDNLPLKKQVYTHASLERQKTAKSAAKSLAKDVIDYTQKYLRRNPHNLDALNMLMATYTFLDDERGIGEADQMIKKAKSLIAAGIDLDQPWGDEKRSTLQKGIDFEDRVLELIRAMGLQAVSTATSGDGGIDILAHSDQPLYSGKYIIQCKDWSNNIGVPVVRDLYGTVMAEGANKGILITTSQFTSPAQDFVEGKPLELIDGRELAALFNEYIKRE